MFVRLRRKFMKSKMSKTILLNFFVMSIFICSGFSTTISDEIERNYGQNEGKFIKKLNWMGPHGNYKDYINRRSNQAFSIQRIAETIYKENNPLIIIFVNSNLMPTINNEISIYSLNLIENGYNTVIMEVSGGTVEDLKSEIYHYFYILTY